MEDNEKQIEEMILDAEVAREPGELQEKDVVHKGDDELPSTMKAIEVKSAGWVYIYDTRTGDRSLCNRNMLPQHLRKKREDGSKVFTTVDPGFRPPQGTLKCMLHKDSPDRAHYDELGLATCTKDNLKSKYQVIRHMQKRHKMEWETIEQERKDIEKDEDRMFQRLMMNKAMTGEAPLYVSDKKKKK